MHLFHSNLPLHNSLSTVPINFEISHQKLKYITTLATQKQKVQVCNIDGLLASLTTKSKMAHQRHPEFQKSFQNSGVRYLVLLDGGFLPSSILTPYTYFHTTTPLIVQMKIIFLISWKIAATVIEYFATFFYNFVLLKIIIYILL